MRHRPRRRQHLAQLASRFRPVLPEADHDIQFGIGQRGFRHLEHPREPMDSTPREYRRVSMLSIEISTVVNIVLLQESRAAAQHAQKASGSLLSERDLPAAEVAV